MSIKCEICKKQPAKLHITQVKETQKYSLHICHDCANENGISGPSVNTDFSIESYLTGFAKPVKASKKSFSAEADVQRTCSNCGLSYGAFKESGRLGCSHCYDVFSDQLKPLLQKVQKEIRHAGKIPYTGNEHQTLKRNISDLRLQLKDAVRLEQYEDAARLRDEIRNLEGKLAENQEN